MGIEVTNRELETNRRWITISIVISSTFINFLDRQVFAALAPTIKREFNITNAEYGNLVAVFALAYAGAAPIVGWLIDRVGVDRGLRWAVGMWSLAGVGSGLSRSLGALVGFRALLGAGESAGMPALAKANALYLRPSEFGFSLAANNIAITLGSSSAPLLVAAIAPAYGWRAVFLATGAAGLLWIPLWAFASTKRSPAAGEHSSSLRIREFLSDSRLWGLTMSNALIMTVYTVWTNWMTVYFVDQLHLSDTYANRHYVWIPPIFATLGGVFGSWLTYRWIVHGFSPVAARLRGCWVAAIFVLVTAAVPLASSAPWATATISMAMFWAMSLQMNVHILPLDIFGVERAGISVAVLTFSYGLMQTLISPVVGIAVDRFGFSVVCYCLSVLPLAGVWVLKAFVSAPEPSAITSTRGRYA